MAIDNNTYGIVGEKLVYDYLKEKYTDYTVYGYSKFEFLISGYIKPKDNKEKKLMENTRRFLKKTLKSFIWKKPKGDPYGSLYPLVTTSPDLVMVKDSEIIFVEVKVNSSELTVEQKADIIFTNKIGKIKYKLFRVRNLRIKDQFKLDYRNKPQDITRLPFPELVSCHSYGNMLFKKSHVSYDRIYEARVESIEDFLPLLLKKRIAGCYQHVPVSFYSGAGEIGGNKTC